MGCCDSAVQRFFPLLLPFYFPIHYGDLWPRLQEYFFSVYQNTVSQLTLFTAGIGALFIGNHVHQNHLLNQSRARLPLVLGGWGTRGKSGTERIKAAMLNGLGYSIFSKTTGCEAMFIYAPPFTPSKELFLFRPYDKATIWEQFNVLRLADKLGADVFLWECMGLTPAYVEVLQKRWTRDDISTITNTYPDHEDLQGPAGYDIPKVMTNFIPENAVLLTSEEQWLPVLRTAAEKFNTRIRPVTWLEAGLLTPDILARFPYEEHPYNIALVAALGEELGLDKTFALKAMADNVVADIGVLKTYPAAKILSRQLEFVMGMSANERFGAMGNWTRMGFDRHHLDVDPHIWLTTVINNRADRIPRSRVFASMLVEDVRADQHVLIGTNLTGMVGYIKEAWDSYAPSLTLWPTTKENEAEKTPEQVLLATAVHFRVPVTPEQLQKRLERMLGATDCCDESHKQSLLALWQEPEQLAEQLPKTLHPDIRQTMMDRMQRDIANFKTYQEFSQQLHQACDQTTRDNRFRALLWTWFEQKIFVVHSPYTTGNQIIKKIASLTPPGFYNRIMGMQNIKGTGLDFVYRFQAWENCHKALIQMQSNDSRVVEQGLMQLTSFKEHGYLTEEAVRETVAQLEQSPLGQREHIHAELTVLLSNLNQAMQEIQQQNQSDSGQQSNDGLLINVLHWLEEFLDAGDAVKRRKIADQIYKDMVGERISLQAAAQEIQKLNKRQKGGWLQQQVDTLKQKLKARKKPQQAQSASQHKI
jgi:poly-gamma-glutamate synthase PgsB/CapB